MTISPARPPLRFQTPQGWPQPPADWVVRNQGWQPPAGWTPPTSGQYPLAPAPQGWRFWAPNGAAWDDYRQPFAKHAHRAILVGGIMLGVAIAITLAGMLGEFGRSYYLLYGTLIFGAIRLITGLAALRKVDPAARAAIGPDSIEVRRQLDSEGYRAYLDRTARERAETGAPAQTFDEFGFGRDAQPWDGAAVPALQLPEGAPSPTMALWASAAPAASAAAAFTDADTGRRSRRGLWMGLGAAAAIVMGIAIPLAIPHGSTSTALSSLSNSNSAADSTVYVPTDGWTVLDTNTCTTGTDCLNIDVQPVASCPAATIDWGFADSKTGSDKATRTTPVALVAGQTAHVSMPIGDDMAGAKYIFLEAVHC